MRYTLLTQGIFASHLRQSGGIESEIIDLLQGRVPRTVFARHYFTPSLDYRAKVLCALDKLRKGHRRVLKVFTALSVLHCFLSAIWYNL